MSNILAFPTPQATGPDATLTELADAVRGARHPQSDVFWLKENAELLGMAAACNLKLNDATLSGYAAIYETLADQMRLYPQYYRFWLSICLDLEDLGIEGDTGEALCRNAARAGLAEAELSDLQRAEARRLMARRGVGREVHEGALAQRLHDFINRSDTFALPNKKAAYELTHIVFYLSAYGQRDPELSRDAQTSLEYAGVLAFLDQDMDLLAEVCTAQRYAGVTPSHVWTRAIAAAHGGIRLHSQPGASLHDGFHAYLVTGWAMEAEGQRGFIAPVPEGALRFAYERAGLSALPPMSAWLGEDRYAPRHRGDWAAVRDDVFGRLCEDRRAVLESAERSSPVFEAFFERFARV